MENTLLQRRTGAETLAYYARIRAFTERLCETLQTEDFVVQSTEDVSPTKWHLAHTTWFFETFVLKPHQGAYREHDPLYAYLFNSYYVQAGARHCRAKRGYISRPTVSQVFDYRRHVDDAVADVLESADEELLERLAPLVEIGLHHEQQHQELMLTDIKHVFSVNPLRPAYRAADDSLSPSAPAREWVAFPGGVNWIGHAGPGFAYDNEGPRHRAFLEPFALSNRLVTNSEFLEFMEDGGYQRAELWLSLGWRAVEERGWTEPFYWERSDGGWRLFTLSGMLPLALGEPVTHLSYFEADAYARWAGARLPTEAEWEVAAAALPQDGNFVEKGALHPRGAAAKPDALQQMFGDVWEWTQSPYTPYPGFAPAAGALGEYNGKFMCNQFVLRGGSCATSETHIRATYRNFFPPEVTWQFTGLRLATDT